MPKMAFEVHPNFSKNYDPLTGYGSGRRNGKGAGRAIRLLSTPVFFFAAIVLAYALLSHWRYV